MGMRYVLCSRDCGSNSLVYYTGTESFHGGSYYGNVLEAKRFDSLQEVAELISKPSSEFYLGVNIIGIADVTFEKLEESKRELDSGKGKGELYREYHNPNYAIR